jgi:hypothetical protein
MARLRDDEQQMVYAYAHFKAGVHTGSALSRLLEKQFEENAISERQVRRWIAHFKKLDASVLRLDDPFEWHRLDDYGIPWEASHDLMGLWARAQDRRGATPDLPTSPPTVRQMRWWWRVMQAAPTMLVSDVLAVAGAFVERELRHDVLGKELYLLDLEACVSYRPWDGWPTDTTNAKRYEAAVAAGIVPKLRAGSYAVTMGLARRMASPDANGSKVDP